MIGRCSLVDGSMSNGVSRSSSVLDISNISTIGIINLVVDSLDPAIGKSNRVGSSGGISITVLSSMELGSRVVISNGIFIGIHGRAIIFRLLVGSSMVNRGMVDNRGSMVDNGGSMVDNRSSMVGWSMVNNRGGVVGRGMVDRGGMVGGGMVDRGGMVGRGMVDNRGVIRSRLISRDSSRSMDSSSILLRVVVGIDRLRSSMRLAGYRSMSSSMGFVEGHTDRGSISMLDHLMVRLVSSSCSKQSNANESLHVL